MISRLVSVRRRAAPLLRRAARAAVVGALGLLLASFVWAYVEARRLDSRIASLAAAGEPLTPEEMLARQPPVPPEEDAAPFYEAAIALTRSSRPQAPALRALGRVRNTLCGPIAAPADVEQIVRADLEAHGLALEMLDRGAPLPECRLRGWPDAALVGLRPLATAASLRTAERLRRGDTTGAVDSLVASLRLLRICDSQPSLMSGFLFAALSRSAQDDVQGLIEVGGLSPDSLVVLGRECAGSAERARFEDVLHGERAWALSASPGGGIRASASAPTPLHSAVWFRAYVGYLDSVAELVAASRAPADRRRERIRSVEPRGFFARMAFGSMVGLYDTLTRARAGWACATAALAVEGHRLTHGTLPDALADLDSAAGGSLPPDPFTGAALLFRRDGQAYTVYSVGPDGKDDGGQVEAPEDDAPDVGLRIQPCAPGHEAPPANRR